MVKKSSHAKKEKQKHAADEHDQESLAAPPSPPSLNNPTADEEEVAGVLLNLMNLVLEDKSDGENAAAPVVTVYERDGKSYRVVRDLKKGGAWESFCENHGFVDENFVSAWDTVKQEFCFFVINNNKKKNQEQGSTSTQNA